MASSNEVQHLWQLLQDVLPLFVKATPTESDVDNGHFGLLDDDVQERTKNTVTTIRFEIRRMRIKRSSYSDNINQLNDEPTKEDILQQCKILLRQLENLVTDDITIQNEETSMPVRFPKILALRNLLQGERNPDEFIQIPTRENLHLYAIALEKFHTTMETIFANQTFRRDLYSLTQGISSDEINTLRDTHTFSSSCHELFESLKDWKCGSKHQARIFLYGRQENQTEIELSACRTSQWVSTTPQRLNHQPANSTSDAQICKTMTMPRVQWPPPKLDPMDSTRIEFDDLSKHISNSVRPFSLKHRYSLVYLLAFQLFHFYKSSWIQSEFCKENVFLRHCNEKLSLWYPHIRWDLHPEQNSVRGSECIAALGVLIAELITSSSFGWEKNDTEYGTNTKSHLVRLRRILDKEGDGIPYDYRLVCEACWEFYVGVKSPNPYVVIQDNQELNSLALIYKWIVAPSYRLLRRDFWYDKTLFKEIPPPCRNALGQATQQKVAKLQLFDDNDTTDQHKIGHAEEFKKSLEHLQASVRRIRSRLNSKPPNHGRIKIAILDSGICENDKVITGAVYIQKIQGMKSWIGECSEYNDTYGHGTHVTRLAIETAPEAEIFVAKICAKKIIDPSDESMSNIAEAIKWAVDECEAHILSLSFGFDKVNYLIDKEIRNAIDKGRLVLAAASNNGGLSGRAYPAISSGVICIHACDGLGNKGDMNPTFEDNTNNFTTLGVGVPSRWEAKEVWKSGTSFATPIAAGLAANILEFINFYCEDLSDHTRKVLHTSRGMTTIFQELSEKRDGYQFIRLNQLWNGKKTEKEIAQKIQDIVDKYKL